MVFGEAINDLGERCLLRGQVLQQLGHSHQPVNRRLKRGEDIVACTIAGKDNILADCSPHEVLWIDPGADDVAAVLLGKAIEDAGCTDGHSNDPPSVGLQRKFCQRSSNYQLVENSALVIDHKDLLAAYVEAHPNISTYSRRDGCQPLNVALQLFAGNGHFVLV